MPATKLMDALARVEEHAEGDRISVGDVVTSLNQRGFGTLLIIPSLLVVLPTGAIPFLPAVCAAFMIIICAQIVVGRRHPWLPKFMMKMGISRNKYDRTMEYSAPFIQMLDHITHPRLTFLTLPLAQRLIALLCIFLSIGIAIVAVFPFAADPLALTILCFALGLSARDGLMTAVGFIMLIVAVSFMPLIIESSESLMGPHLMAPLPSGLNEL